MEQSIEQLNYIIMEEGEMNKKVERLCEIIAEAKQIIGELEKYAATQKYVEFDKIRISELPLPYGNLSYRFFNACKAYDINTLQDLLITPVWVFKEIRNIGEKSILLAQRVIKEEYGIDWV